MSNGPILVIDDNPINLKLVRVVLSGEGFDVRIAKDAEEAVVLMDAFRPRLILMDLQLPGMDGFELTRRLKSDPATRDILVVALTSYAMKGDERRAYEAGCDGYLAKPIDTGTLPRIVAAYLARDGADPGSA